MHPAAFDHSRELVEPRPTYGRKALCRSWVESQVLVCTLQPSGNLALALGDACVKSPQVAASLTNTDVVARLLALAKMDKGPTQSNAALALARFAKSNEVRGGTEHEGALALSNG